MIAKYASPKFYDKKVQEINDDLHSLGWIENIYAITQVGIDEEGTFPEIYKNDGSKKSIRVYPDGNSISFFVLNDPMTQLEEGDVFQVSLTLIVWADLSKVYQNKTHNYTTELIDDVLGVLEDHSSYDLVIEQQNVFDEYTQLEKIENQNVMLPNTAFKITFNVDITQCA